MNKKLLSVISLAIAFQVASLAQDFVTSPGGSTYYFIRTVNGSMQGPGEIFFTNDNGVISYVFPRRDSRECNAIYDLNYSRGSSLGDRARSL